MNLEEEFNNQIQIIDRYYYLLDSEIEFATQQCVKIAEDYAIGFAEWIAKNGYYARLNCKWEVNILGEFNPPITASELFQLYQKNKGK